MAGPPAVARKLTGSGEKSGWDWDALRSRCLREARRIVRSPELAEDVVHEALLRAWRRRDECKNQDDPVGWVLQITRNECFRVLAKAKADDEQTRDEGWWESRPLHSDPQAQATGAIDVREALKTLPALDQRLVSLRYRLDLRNSEISRLTGVPEATVRVRLHRARLRLRDCFAETLGV